MRGDWRKIRNLSRTEFLILAQAAALFPTVKLAQRWIRLDKLHARLRRLFGNGPKLSDDRRQPISADNVTRLVRVAARRGLVRPTCLQHALVLWTQLHRHGFEAAIRFGVRKNQEVLEAHAWVEIDGRILSDPADAGGQFLPFDRPVISGQVKLP
ncbi:MAG: lasso peptide biosynthesis B2 protein [Gammaproteobacteria bacterium]|nr:lasso peptide biosynthesis B2 protein [Gammaproteobacteria bacterium]MDH3411999.1 lasso peptide biosynthesis B2 protein [Gammaproteobacteria bacterium]